MPKVPEIKIPMPPQRPPVTVFSLSPPNQAGDTRRRPIYVRSEIVAYRVPVKVV